MPPVTAYYPPVEIAAGRDLILSGCVRAIRSCRKQAIVCYATVLGNGRISAYTVAISGCRRHIDKRCPATIMKDTLHPNLASLLMYKNVMLSLFCPNITIYFVTVCSDIRTFFAIYIMDWGNCKILICTKTLTKWTNSFYIAAQNRPL